MVNRTSRLILAAAVSAWPWLLAGDVLAQSKRSRPSESGDYPRVMGLEAKSRDACEEAPGRVFAGPLGQTECIAYYVVEPSRKAEQTVMFLDGDVPGEMFRDGERMKRYLEAAKGVMRVFAERHRVRFVYVARPGVFGSSGSHGLKARNSEAQSIAGAIDQIKEKLGIERVTLAGQSGGSVVIAGLFARGRTDIACAVLGSGRYDIGIRSQAGAEVFNFSATMGFDPSVIAGTYIDGMKSVEAMRTSRDRRIFVLGDPKDSRTPFAQQKAYAEAVKAAGHHVELLTANAKDGEHHGLSIVAMDLAGRCAAGASDAAIRKAATAGSS